MLFKLFKKHQKVQTTPPPPPVQPKSPVPVEPKSPALRIIHAGGHIEAYYMAIPAKRILESHPGFVLARPDVFRRPWDAVVLPEETLRPGQKFFLVPRRSLRKLRRRIRQPITGFSIEIFSGDSSYSSDGDKLVHKPKSNDKSVRLFGIDKENKEDTDKNLERMRNVVTWHPSLTSIMELDTCDNNDLLVNIESMIT